MAFKSLIVFTIGFCLCNLSDQSQSFYSLQPAVEALSEREAQLALRNEIENGNIDDFVDSDDFEWNNNDYDSLDRERDHHLQVPNRAFSRYLARPNADYDDFYPSDYKKRSMFRKRDASVFRERSRVPYLQHQQQQALAEKFLRAIEDEREREEQEEYHKQLRNLWNRYQVDESDIERDLFDNDIEPEYFDANNDDIDRKKKKRQNSGNAEVAPAYWNDKRSMPLLPWLPVQRKKRFPVTKRSSNINNDLTSLNKNDKVSQDLKGIFGAAESEKIGDIESKKKKRSSEDSTITHAETTTMKSEKLPTSSAVVGETKKEHKRSTCYSDEDEEADNENDNDDEEGDEDDIDTGDDSSESDSDRKKKKRDTSKSFEVVRAENIPKKKLDMKKKSLQWSNIFGIDRKKKSMGLIFHPLEDVNKRKKKCVAGECFDGEELDEVDYGDDDDNLRKRKRSREEKFDAMDKKLKTIENLIIDDSTKYFENHDGSLSPSEARVMRNRVADRLATAYSLEKMRKAIARLKQSIAMERDLIKGPHNELDDVDDAIEEAKKKKAKRVAVKKEKAEFDNNDHDIESSKKTSPDQIRNDLKEDEEEKKKKKKRSQKKSEFTNLINDDMPMSESYMGGRMAECPLLDRIEKKCRGIDIMSGDSNQNLLEACGAHQLCYLCSDSQSQCDYGYMNEAEDLCGRDIKCKMSARKALAVLRDLGGSRVPPRECIRNPCLSMALRTIAF
ncbi:CLUMA_CG016184, isoform A [Clunio marinus]|uniref:CLUMA_CG016184, isoform A n=1 Tax=Clunio marinus TaxID=568069 RepID=A0A1J1IT39_9DIPT|nr:CLUMA_CG016184, isoform A [Clunio marinus]